jgi:hypothetical protein
VVKNVEFPCNLEVFGYLLGDGGGEFWGPLLDWMEVERLKQVIISWIRMVATVEACLFEVGKSSTHPEKVPTRTKRCLCHLMGGI